MTEPILGFFNEYRFLSNFEGPGFIHQGIHYQTNEHFYQSWKTNDLDAWNTIRLAQTPGQCKRLGRRAPIRPDWEQLKNHIMDIGLAAKFSSTGSPANTDVTLRLLNTDDAYLEETNTWGDTYWGVCNGQGLNMLGYALMNLRGKLGGHGVVPNPTVHPET